MPRAASTACLALLLTLAGCGAVVPGGGGPGTTTPTATPAPVPVDGTATPVERTTELPPGVSPDGVDAAVLAEATARSVRGENVRFQFDEREARPEFSLGTVYAGPRVVVESVAPDRYHVRVERVSERGGGLSVATLENATYVTPGRAYRYDGANVTVGIVEGRVGLPSRQVAGYVETYLDVRNVTLERRANGSVVLRGAGGASVNGTDYSVQAVVGPDGVVRSFEGIYTRDGRVQFAEFSLSEGGVFRPPEWYRAANTTVSPTGTPRPCLAASGEFREEEQHAGSG